MSRFRRLGLHLVRPAKEADAAKALIDQGVDVIASHTDSTAPLAEAAKTNGAVIGFGQASDMAEYKDGPRVSSIIDNWAPYYVKRVGALMDGSYEQSTAGRAFPKAKSRSARSPIWSLPTSRPKPKRCAMPSRLAPITRSPARSTSRTARPGWPKAKRRRDGDLLGMNVLRRRYLGRHPAVSHPNGLGGPGAIRAPFPCAKLA
jgi:basic membrane protein A and related proteins